MKHEYHEGLRVGENFKRLATAVLQKPKIAAAPSKPPKVKTAGKHKG